MNKGYTDEQFLKDFPEKTRICPVCKKPFKTQFDAKCCSDKCWKKDYNQKYFKANYVKSGRRFEP